jgi:virulence-associated protein VagC
MARSRKTPGDRHEGRARARVFWSGRSQAVRLPKAFRFSTKEVAIRHEGDSVVLEPIEIERDEKGWPEAWWRLAGSAPEFDIGDRRAGHERGDVLTVRDD